MAEFFLGQLIKRNVMKIKIFLIALLFPLIFAVIYHLNKEEAHTSLKEINPFQLASLSVETFYIKGHGWGFEIYVDGKSFIYQEKIESLTIPKGYENEQDAVRVAELVIHKIRRNTLPPLISIKELDSLRVGY